MATLSFVRGCLCLKAIRKLINLMVKNVNYTKSAMSKMLFAVSKHNKNRKTKWRKKCKNYFRNPEWKQIFQIFNNCGWRNQIYQKCLYQMYLSILVVCYVSGGNFIKAKFMILMLWPNFHVTVSLSSL